MLTADGCRRRRERLWETIGDECDLVVISDPVHLTYFTNFSTSIFEFRSNDATAAAVLARDRATLIADNLLQPFLDRSFVDEAIAPVWYEGKRSAGSRRAQLAATVLEFVLDAASARRIGIEYGAAPVGLTEGLRHRKSGLELVDLDPVIAPLRRSKDPDEVEVTRRAIRAGDAGFARAMEVVRPGMTEQEAFRLIQEAVIARAGEPVRVYGDFVSGRRTEAVGGPASERTIARGDLFLLDMSAVIHGYRGDAANTFCVGAPPTPWQLERFNACLDAIAAGEAMLRPGSRCRAIDEAVRAALGEHARLSTHRSHTGHGLGLSHPEAPFIVRESEETLRRGDVVTLEPGLYIAGEGGMRFERNYLITEDGFETLSGHELRIEV
ncbi:MAG: Xaa-Pro peptidase family protein [Isosphaeraceae bacterium]|nr:Xaa-Pro peptidase family protein [Isosphaeraceae bacterium]